MAVFETVQRSGPQNIRHCQASSLFQAFLTQATHHIQHTRSKGTTRTGERTVKLYVLFKEDLSPSSLVKTCRITCLYLCLANTILLGSWSQYSPGYLGSLALAATLNLSA